MKTIKIKIHPSKLQADIKTNDEIAQINLDSSVIYSPLDASFINNQTVSEYIDKNGKYFITYDRTKYTGLDTAVVDVSVNDASAYNRGVEEGKEEQKALMTSLVVTENGTYSRPDGYSDVSVNVPSEVPQQDASVTYTQNGEYTILPDPGYALSKVDVSVALDTSAFYEEGRVVGRVEGYNQGYGEGETAGYNEGYPAGTAAQKAKLVHLDVSMNGYYSREDGYSDVSVNVPIPEPVPTQTKSVVYTSNGEYTVTPDASYNLSQVDVSVNLDTEAYYDLGYDDGVDDQKAKLITGTFTQNGTYNRADGWNQVDVSIDVSTYYDQGFADGSTAGAAYQKSLLDSSTFTENGTFTSENGWNSVTVDVSVSPGGPLQAKTTDASTSLVTVTPDSSYYGLSEVVVNAVDASIDPNILPENIKKDVVILGVTGTLDSSSQPSGPTYATYEYLRYPNGSAFYDTGITLSPSILVELKGNILDDGNITHGTASYFGSQDIGDIRIFGAGGMFYYDREANSNIRINGGSNDGNIHEMVYGNYYIEEDGTVIVTGNEVTSGTGAYTNANIGIFGAYTDPSMNNHMCANGDVTVYYFKIYDGSTLVRDFVPATDASGNVGLLDKVNVEFYYNLDSGDSSLGAYVSDYPNGGSSVVYQSKTVDPSTNQQVVTPDASQGYNALSSVTVRAVEASIDSDIIPENIKAGVNILGVEGTMISQYNGRNQTKTADSSTSLQVITYDSPDYTGLTQVTINPYILENITIDSSTGTTTHTAGVNYNGIGQVTVRPYVLDTKTVDASTSTITVTSDASALSQVTVNPVTSLIDPNIQPENIKAGVNILGVTGELTDDVQVDLQDKTVTPGTTQLQVTADSSYDGLGTVYVNAAPTETTTVDASISQQILIPSSGKVGFSQVTVNPYNLRAATVDSSTSSQTIIPGIGYDGLSQVVVNPYSLQSISVSPDASAQVYTPDSSHNGFSQVTVRAVTAAIDNNIRPENIVQGITILGVEGEYVAPSEVSLGYEEIYRRLINI